MFAAGLSLKGQRELEEVRRWADSNCCNPRCRSSTSSSNFVSTSPLQLGGATVTLDAVALLNAGQKVVG